MAASATGAASLERQAYLLTSWGTWGQLEERDDLQRIIDKGLVQLHATASKGEQALAQRVRPAAEFSRQLEGALLEGRDKADEAAIKIASEGVEKLVKLDLVQKGLAAIVPLYAMGEKSLADVTHFVDVLQQSYNTDARASLVRAHFMHGDADQGLTLLGQMDVHRRNNHLEPYVVEMLKQKQFVTALEAVERLVDLEDPVNYLRSCSDMVFYALKEKGEWDLYERAINSVVKAEDRVIKAYDLVEALVEVDETDRARRILEAYREQIDALPDDEFHVMLFSELRETLNPGQE